MKIAIALTATIAICLIPTGAAQAKTCTAPAGAVCAKPHFFPGLGASTHARFTPAIAQGYLSR